VGKSLTSNQTHNRENDMSTLTLADLKPGSVVVDDRNKIAIVTEHKLNYPKNPIIFVYTAGPGGQYKGPVSMFKAVIGTVELDKLTTAGGGVGAVPQRNDGVDSGFFIPEVLKGIKIGDKILLRSPNNPQGEVVIYQGYKRSRPKFPISFTRNGRPMKGTLGSFIGKV